MSLLSGVLGGAGSRKLTFYHVTPTDRVQRILAEGIQPRAESGRVEQVAGVYLVQDDFGVFRIAQQLQWAREARYGRKARTDWAVLEVRGVEGEQQDPAAVREGGVFVTQTIPAHNIKPRYTIPAKALTVSAWKRCFNILWQPKPYAAALRQAGCIV